MVHEEEMNSPNNKPNIIYIMVTEENSGQPLKVSLSGEKLESIGVRATPMTFDMTDRGIGTSERLWRRSSQ